MTLSVEELLVAKETVSTLLDELGLEAYLFEVQPGEQGWEVRVECALEEGWQNTRIAVEREALAACRDDESLRRQLLGDWEGRLHACKRNEG